MGIKQEIEIKYGSVGTVVEIRGLADMRRRLAKLEANRLVDEYRQLSAEQDRIVEMLDERLADATPDSEDD